MLISEIDKPCQPSQGMVGLRRVYLTYRGVTLHAEITTAGVHGRNFATAEGSHDLQAREGGASTGSDPTRGLL